MRGKRLRKGSESSTKEIIRRSPRQRRDLSIADTVRRNTRYAHQGRRDATAAVHDVAGAKRRKIDS